jgi:3,5-epimerase/4-reductase
MYVCMHVLPLGERGRPNIDWCETHQEETVRANVLGQLNVVDLCSQRKIHVTVITSGALYSGPPGAPVKETDPPNCADSFYAQMRVSLETLLKAYSNVLVLRYPTTT